MNNSQRSSLEGRPSIAAKCPLCGAVPVPGFTTRDFNRRATSEVFHYYRCRGCASLFLHPIPEDLSAYYKEDYYEIPATPGELALAARSQQFKVDILRKHLPAGRLLEVGPAFGLFATLAKAAGYQVEAIEQDARCCKYLNDTLGIPATQSPAPEVALRTMGPYDAIVLWHVLEHLSNPAAFIRTAADRLNPSGILLIAVPNPSAFQFRLMGPRWPHVDAPRHLILMPVAALTAACRSSGLALDWVTTDDRGGRGWNNFGWTYAASNLVGSKAPPLTAKGFGRIMTLLSRPVERLPLRGAAYTAVFRKPANP